VRSGIQVAAVAGFIGVMPVPAMAWDYPGHRIVGAIADIVLQRDDPATYQKVKELLGKDADGHAMQRGLGEVAVYPDCAKDEPEFCGRRASPEEIEYVLRNLVHPSFHFINNPLPEGTYRAGKVGTSESDVVQMLVHTVRQLRGKSNFRKHEVELTNTEAVWLLAHLVGDIHQPLHVGQVYFDNTCKKRINPNDSNEEYLTTAGGNFIALEEAVGGIKNLHLYWDVVAGANAMRREGVAGDEAAFARKLAAAPPAGWETSGDAETWPQQWVAEIMPLAVRAYKPDISGEVRAGPPPFPSRTVACKWGIALDQTYHDDASETAGKQLHKAGYRLAALLKAALRQP
jgi:hypothetical protein